jgi:acyl-CoA synthetase (NDP forming)/GNAT superfamily N-acetyltransferase
MDTTAAGAARGVYALLADGTTVEIRPATPQDLPAVQAMHDGMSADNSYLRFFGYSRLSAEQEARRVGRPPAAGHVALLAVSEGRIIGVASYEAEDHAETAEVAFAVPDSMRGRGIGTLLLEHLVSAAVQRGIETFTASVLAENAEMQKVFADAGLSFQTYLVDGVLRLTCELPCDDADPGWGPYLDAAAVRERGADVASLRRVFAPESVAVVGASRRMGTTGRAILHNIVTAGYGGRVYAVNPHAAHMEAVPCLASVAALPEPVDLAVIAVPPAAVSTVADQCGRRGIKALAVITMGLDPPQGADLLAICRRYGMRLAGPGCFGIAVPGIGLDATFAARHPAPGPVGLVMQSGGLGVALADRLSQLGIGVSCLASVGAKYDISGNDLLVWWEHDPATKLAVLYLESFGNPRKFARTARQAGRTMPILAVPPARTPASQHTTARSTPPAAPLITRDALFRQAGIIATADLSELLGAAALLATQPIPAGPHVAIVSNVPGAGALAAAACAQHGLTVHRTTGETRRRLHALLPPHSTVTGPIDTTATITTGTYRRALELAAADHGVHAILALALPTAATGNLTTAIRTAHTGIPIAAVILDQPQPIQLLPATTPTQPPPPGTTQPPQPATAPPGTAPPPASIPSYADPEAAVRALAHATTYGTWRSRPAGHIPHYSDTTPADARTLVRDYLTRHPNGGWLPPTQTTALLAHYGIHQAGLTPVTSADDAIRVAAALTGPIVLKADVTGPPQHSDTGTVQLDLRTETDIRRAHRLLTAKYGRLRQILIQPMITGGTDVTISVTQDPTFGPLIAFGPSPPATAPPAGHTARLAPLTDTDADELIQSAPPAPQPPSHHPPPATSQPALQDLLLRTSTLADDLPEITQLDLSPIITRPDQASVINAQILITPAQPQDPFLRQLG